MDNYASRLKAIRALCVSFPLCVCFLLDMSCPVYLLHAYDYCPEDPMICLCLAVSSLGRAMQRQSDNRHHLIAQVRKWDDFRRLFLTCLQGMVFLSHYRRIRKQDGDPVLPEIEFNFGRAFQQLGEYDIMYAYSCLTFRQGSIPSLSTIMRRHCNWSMKERVTR